MFRLVKILKRSIRVKTVWEVIVVTTSNDLRDGLVENLKSKTSDPGQTF